MSHGTPSIGIVVCAREQNRVFTALPYIQAVADHGGIPFLIPYYEDYRPDFLRSCQNKFDGFLFCGGGDINPLLFHAFPSGFLECTDYSFDLFQLRLMSYLTTHGRKPLLAICKGMQILTLACHGSLYQDLSENPNYFNHCYPAGFRSEPAHLIRTESGSRIREILGLSVYVNSCHHQGIQTTGPDLIIGSRSLDGLIESVEAPAHPFLIGVQWHPECMYLHSEKMSRLFSAFLHSC